MLKKIVSVLVAICLVITLMPAISAADSIESNDKGLSIILFVTLFDTPIVSLNDTVILSNRHSSQNH